MYRSRIHSRENRTLLLLMMLIVFGVQFLSTSIWALRVNEEYDYVDNNTSDVDGKADLGTHSNFTGQQYGPDGIYDTLTEGEMGPQILDLYVDSFDNTRTGWTRVGTPPYLNTQNYPVDYAELGANQTESVGDFGFQNSSKSSESINSVTIRVYGWRERGQDDIGFYLWNGSSWSVKYVINRINAGWVEYDVTARLDTWTKIDGAKIYLEGDTTQSGDGKTFADCALLRINYTDIGNELMELEVQWTNARYDLPVEELCIFGGTLASEPIEVDVWNGGVWQNLSPGLSSGWNNISVTSYLVAPTFTIRFKSNNLVGSQDSWQIDSTLLHTWAETPIANFLFTPQSPSPNGTVIFNASDSYDTDGAIVSYFWDFGDGRNGTSIITTHNYTSIGTYNVTLTVTDNDNLTDSESKLIVVKKYPIATFTYSPTIPLVNQTVTCNASLSTPNGGTITSYQWTFGDGTNVNETDPITYHSYTMPGTYNVTLKITDSEGLWDTENKSLIVQTAPVYVHDVNVLNVIPSATEVDLGQVVNITVIVRNEGNATETFNVTLYYDNNIIGTQTVTNLAPNGDKVLTFSWNTAGVTTNVDYTIKAEASTVQEETDTENNTKADLTIKVRSQDSSLPSPWDPILPYAMPIVTVVGLLVAILVKKEIISLVLAGFLGRLWFSLWKMIRNRKGFEFFNEMTNGGIPDNYSSMIIGGANSGKSVLCQQLIHTYLSKEKPCIHVTYDSFPDEVRKSMKSFSWGSSKHEEMGVFKFVDCYSPTADVTSKEEIFVENPFSLSDLGIAMSTAVDQSKQKSPKIFLDSTAPLFTRLESSKVVEFLQDRSARIKGENGAFFFTVGKGTVPPNLMSRLTEIVDCVIELQFTRTQKGKILRQIQIAKLRGRSFVETPVSLEIKPGKGIVFFTSKKVS